MSKAIGPWVADDYDYAGNRGVCERRTGGNLLMAWVYRASSEPNGPYGWRAMPNEGRWLDGTAATVDEAKSAADAALGLRPSPSLRPDLLETLALTVRVGDPVATMAAVQVLADWCEEQGARGVWRVSQEWVAGRWRSTVYRDGVCVAGGER